MQSSLFTHFSFVFFFFLTIIIKYKAWIHLKRVDWENWVSQMSNKTNNTEKWFWIPYQHNKIVTAIWSFNDFRNTFSMFIHYGLLWFVQSSNVSICWSTEPNNCFYFYLIHALSLTFSHFCSSFRFWGVSFCLCFSS